MEGFIAGVLVAAGILVGGYLITRNRLRKQDWEHLVEAQRKFDEALKENDMVAADAARKERDRVAEEIKNAGKAAIVRRFFDAMSKRPGSR
jgi:hypothetical protein